MKMFTKALNSGLIRVLPFMLVAAMFIAVMLIRIATRVYNGF